MKWWVVVAAILGVGARGMLVWWQWPREGGKFISPRGQIIDKPLVKYSFERLKQKDYQGGEISLGEDNKFFLTYEGKRVSGQVNIPSGKAPVGGWPVVIMLRGYVDKEVYETGIGTRKVAAELAKNGFMTLAADFLGYGESDPESNDMLEARFEKIITAMYLLNAVCQVPQANCQKLLLWGHSNGGQIGLSVLAISGQAIPTVLCAPVSKPFPYSILYYSDDLDDRGKMIRRAVAEFEENYNVDEYSVISYYEWIKAPMQIQQGTADDAVPKAWSDQLVKDLEQTITDVTYHVYTGADHNLNPAWNTAVARDVDFFTDNL